MKKEDLKTKILFEINKDEFPDLEFLFSKESLELFLEILKELLQERKENFKKLIKIPLEKIQFEDFEDFDKLSHLFLLLQHINMVDKSDISQKTIETFEPIYTDFLNKIQFSKEYYERVCFVLEKRNLDEEQRRILELEKKSFELNWINLPKETQKEINKINIILSKLYLKFQDNIVKSKKKFSYHIKDFEIIKELPEATLENARKKAESEKLSWYLFDADPTSFWDIMEYCSSEKVRKYFQTKRNQFATEKWCDNRAIVLEILKLTQKKAKLMWYKNFAEVSLSTKMAKKPEVVFELLEWIAKKAKKKSKEELKELKKYFQLKEIKPWDNAYYSRKLKEEKYLLDEKELKNYFWYHVINYLFSFVKDFYGIEMRKIETKTYNNDVEVFEVYKNWKLISYYLLDLFYRETKRPWAWAENVRRKFWKKVPIMINVCNFQKQEWNILFTMRDVETLFHEFGHALHEMLSESKYSDLSWFNVEWDFVELPSQINENWVNNRESLEKLWKHYKTWERIPKNMLDKLDDLKTFMSWLFTIRQIEFGLLDMKLYSKNPPKTVEELDKFCLKIANEVWVFKRWEEYKMYASFSHIFWWWYDAWYYGYIWAELLEADVFEKIKELWMFKKDVWEKFLKTILWQWTKKEAWKLFYDFMWRELSSEAFMKRNWFLTK